MKVKLERVPLQKADAGQVRYTVLDVDREMPKDHIIWSLLCTLFFNPCCLGLAALICSVKARDRMVVGNIEGARKYASSSQTLNIIATVIFFFLLTIVIVFWFLSAQPAGHAVHFGDEDGSDQLLNRPILSCPLWFVNVTSWC